MRAKNLRVGYARSASGGYDYTAEKEGQKRIAYVRRLRSQGIKPDSTSLQDARRAEEISNRTGKPYVSTR